jgi:hypothetical protein
MFRSSWIILKHTYQLVAMHAGDTRIRQFQHEPFCLLTQLALLQTNTTEFTSTSSAKEPLYLHTKKHATSNKQIVYNQSPASLNILHLSTVLTITPSKRTFRSQKACSLITISRTNSRQQKAWHQIKTTHNGPNEWSPIRISELKTMQQNAIQFTFRNQKACNLITISRTNSRQQKAWHLIKTTHNGSNEWPPIRISELKTMQPNAIQFTTTSHNGNKPRYPVRKSRQKIL